jgi:hypothetical protein
VSGTPRLRNFEQSAADAIAIADADLAVGEAFHREVLSELPECEIGSLQFTLPIVIGIHLVDKHSPVFSTTVPYEPLRHRSSDTFRSGFWAGCVFRLVRSTFASLRRASSNSGSHWNLGPLPGSPVPSCAFHHRVTLFTTDES